MPPPGQLTPHQIIVARNLKDGITPPQKQPVKNNSINQPVLEIKTPSIASNSNSNNSINLPGIFQILKTSSIVNLEPNLVNNIQPNNMYIPNNSNSTVINKTSSEISTEPTPAKSSYTSYIIGFVIIYFVFLRKK